MYPQAACKFQATRVYVHPWDDPRYPTAVYVRLPESVSQLIDGGCQCRHCAASGKPGRWDTLAIPLDGGQTWRVHCPELETWQWPRASAEQLATAGSRKPARV